MTRQTLLKDLKQKLNLHKFFLLTFPNQIQWFMNSVFEFKPGSVLFVISHNKF